MMMMMKRVAMMALLCGGAAAQPEVQLDGAAVPSWAVADALGKPFGKNGVVAVVPPLIAQSGGQYWHVEAYDGTLTFVPETVGAAPGRSASALGRANSAPENACGMGWAKGPEEANTCFTEIEGLPPKNWGWSNLVGPGETHAGVPVLIGASQCQGGHHRFNIDVTFDVEAAEIRVNLTPEDGYSLRAAHVYVGEEMLPRAQNGAFSDSPGQFPRFVNVGDNPVVTFDEIDVTKAHYYAVHVNVCPGKDAEPPVPAPESCPSTFLVNHYVCAQPGCTASAANGDLAAKLVAAGWTNLETTGICFTTPGVGFIQYTNLLEKEIFEAESAPAADGTVNYIGVVSLGCGQSLPTPKPGQPGTGGGAGHGNGGPAQYTCADYCLADPFMGS